MCIILNKNKKRVNHSSPNPQTNHSKFIYRNDAAVPIYTLFHFLHANNLLIVLTRFAFFNILAHYTMRLCEIQAKRKSWHLAILASELNFIKFPPKKNKITKRGARLTHAANQRQGNWLTKYENLHKHTHTHSYVHSCTENSWVPQCQQ